MRKRKEDIDAMIYVLCYVAILIIAVVMLAILTAFILF